MGFAREYFAGSSLLSPKILLLDPLHHLEQPGAARDAIRFERWRDCKTDRFLCAAHICNDEVCCQWVQTTLNAFDGSVERFQVDGDIGVVWEMPVAFLCFAGDNHWYGQKPSAEKSTIGNELRLQGLPLGGSPFYKCLSAFPFGSNCGI